MIKTAVIKKINENTWRVYSEKGKNLGTYHSLKAAKKRLKDVEFFKRKDKLLNKKNARTDFYKMILTADDKKEHHHAHTTDTYSALLRDINKESPEKVEEVMRKFKKIFDKALLEDTPVDELENVCLLELKASLDEKDEEDDE